MAVSKVLTRFNPALSMSSTDEEKIAANTIITTTADLADYPEGYEMFRMRVDWVGSAMKTNYYAHLEVKNLDDGHIHTCPTSVLLEKGWTSAWVIFWFGHLEDDEVYAAGNYSARIYATGLFDETINFTVTDSRTQTKNIVFYATDPDGNKITAQVDVNGSMLGTTTLTTTNPLLKTATVNDVLNLTLTADGYDTKTMTVTVKAGFTDPYVVTAVMQPAATPPAECIVTVRTTQDPATCTFDGVDYTTPMQLYHIPAGDHTFLCKKTGFVWMIEGNAQTTPVTRTLLATTQYMETLTATGVTPPTPPVPEPGDYTGTWLDPEYWRSRYGIDIPESDAELTITKTIAPAITLTVRGVQYQKEPWYFCNAPGDENDYICDGDGQLYVRDLNRLYEFSLTETLTNILAFFNITQAVDAGLRGVWLDGAGNGYVWNDANKLLVPVILAQQNIPLQAGGGGLFRLGTKIWKWLKGSPSIGKLKWTTSKGTLILLGASSGQWVNGLVNGAQIAVLIEGYATIAEWGIEETVGTASLGCYQASRMNDKELFKAAIEHFEFVLAASEEMHRVTGIVQIKVPLQKPPSVWNPLGLSEWIGLSPVITLFLKANRENLVLYKTMLDAMPETEKPSAEDKISKIPPNTENMTGSRVIKVLDGDTINIRYNHVTYTVRFVGINAHEISHGSGKPAEYGGNAARDFLQRIIRDGTIVDISIDLAAPADLYGRLLGVVKLNGIDINLLMLRIGAAQTLFIGSNKHVNQTTYQAAEDNAKKMKLGIWNLNKTPKFTVPAEIEAALGIGINAPTASKLKVFGSVNVPSIEKLIAQELALTSGGTYMVTDGKTRKVIDVDDRETKTVKFTPEEVPGETGTIVIEGIADASKVKIVRLEEVEISREPGTYEVSDMDEKKLVRVKAGKKAKTRLHPDKPPLI